MIKINLVLKFEKYGKNLRHNLYVYFSKYAKPQKVLVLSNECFVEVLLKFIFPILMFFFLSHQGDPLISQSTATKLVAFTAVTVCLVVLIKWHFGGGVCKSKARLDGKTAF